MRRVSIEQSIEQVFRAGFCAGWDATGEGFNAEYVGPTHAHEPEEAEDAAWAEYEATLYTDTAVSTEGES